MGEFNPDMINSNNIWVSGDRKIDVRTSGEYFGWLTGTVVPLLKLLLTMASGYGYSKYV